MKLPRDVSGQQLVSAMSLVTDIITVSKQVLRNLKVH